MLTKIMLSMAPLLLAGAAIAQEPSAPADTAQYPPCSATVKDKCIEGKKAPAHKVHKATHSKIVQRDKVHPRKG
jgi:hypothetical protein